MNNCNKARYILHIGETKKKTFSWKRPSCFVFYQKSFVRLTIWHETISSKEKIRFASTCGFVHICGLYCPHFSVFVVVAIVNKPERAAIKCLYNMQ